MSAAGSRSVSARTYIVCNIRRRMVPEVPKKPRWTKVRWQPPGIGSIHMVTRTYRSSAFQRITRRAGWTASMT